MATKKDETYYLVKWLDVEDFSVIPESYFSPGSDLSVGLLYPGNQRLRQRSNSENLGYVHG